MQQELYQEVSSRLIHFRQLAIQSSFTLASEYNYGISWVQLQQ